MEAAPNPRLRNINWADVALKHCPDRTPPSARSTATSYGYQVPDHSLQGRPGRRGLGGSAKRGVPLVHVGR
jgi:hypothetical protein